MTKVKDTKTHKTTTYNNKTFGGILMEVNTLVADAELVLVECNPKQGDVFITSNEMAKKLPFNADKNVPFKPILISRTEKIEVGDKVWDVENKEILDVPRIEIAEHFNKGISNGYYFKILALPEHFSPQQLQDIVDSKLKEGKCLLECERYSNSYATVIDEAAKDSHKHEIRIKLNPHITIYPVEEKMYTREEVKMFLKRLPNFYHYSIIQQAEMLDEWFEQNVK